MNFLKKTQHIHFFFLFFLAIHYLLPLIFIGEVIINPHDNLDNAVVYDHIISKIYKGDLESLNYFLSGEFKWNYLEKLFFPINILHYFLSNELFYYVNDILKKLFPYFSFYLLAKTLNITKFNSALGAFFYSTIIHIHTPLGFGLPLLPYLLYLLVNKDFLNKKHYFVLFLIGLNSPVHQDIFPFILLIPLSLFLRKSFFSLSIYIKFFTTLLIPLILSSLHILVGMLTETITHRADFIARSDLSLSIINTLHRFFYGLSFNEYEDIFYLPLFILKVILLTTFFFHKNKQINFLFYFIIFTLILKTLLGYNLIDYFFVGILEFLKGINYGRVDRVLPIVFTLLLIFNISTLKNKNFINFLYIFSFFSMISLQIMTPLPELGKVFLKKNIQPNKAEEVKKSVLNNNYIQTFKIIFNKKNYQANKTKMNYEGNKTFNNYYKFKDYTYIKDIVKDARVMSVGLDPMIAVMNDIKVIDGYHTVYPLSYKIKFRKIIEKELENNIQLKTYYDSWGSRVYAFYSDEKNLRLNFLQAKKIGADYVISKFPIDNSALKVICYKCNNSSQIFLYKIL